MILFCQKKQGLFCYFYSKYLLFNKHFICDIITIMLLYKREAIMKKILCILIFTITLITISNLNSSAFEFNQNTAVDIDEHWAETYIDQLKNLGIMNGYMGYTNPDSNITRGEFTALITRAFSFEEGSQSKNFIDIPSTHIFYGAIRAASNAGIIGGFEDGTFRPDDAITREQIILILSRIKPGNALKNASFTDISSNYIYIQQLSKVVEDGIIGGYPDGRFMPHNKTTRAEAAKMIVSAMNKYLPQADFSSVHQFGLDYIKNHFTNPDAAVSSSLGSASADLQYIKNTYQEAADIGYTVINTPAEMVVLSCEQNGPFSEMILDYSVTTNINGNTKTYNGQSKLFVITKNGNHSVYNHETRIIEPYFINLTWEVFSSAPSYDTIGVNTVSPTCYRIEKEKSDKSQEINFDGNTFYFNSSLTEDYLNYANKNGYKIWAMYKTDFKTDTASLFLNNNTARQKASKILLAEILKNNLDGINFDFENMYKTDKGAYTNHVKEISIMAHTLGAVVSVDVTKYEKTSSYWSMCFDRNALAKYADYIMLMAYDQYYSGSKTPGPVAGFEWTENSIKLTLNEVPKDKLVLGMPYYIRVWDTKNGKVVSSKAVSMADALKLAEENLAKSEYDKKFGLTKYSWESDDKTIVFWMENAQSIRERVIMAKKYSLAGIASWRRGFETLDVWDAIYSEIQK